MDDTYHTPTHRQLAAEIAAAQDGDELATLCNAVTGGSMRGEDAIKLLIMVLLSALHAPGADVNVAGIRAIATATEVRYYVCGEIGCTKLAAKKEEG